MQTVASIAVHVTCGLSMPESVFRWAQSPGAEGQSSFNAALVNGALHLQVLEMSASTRGDTNALRYGIRPEFALSQDTGTYGSQIISDQDGGQKYGMFTSGLIALELLKHAQNHGWAYGEKSIHRALK